MVIAKKNYKTRIQNLKILHLQKLYYSTTKNYRDNFKIFASNAIMFNHSIHQEEGLTLFSKKIVRGLCEIKYNKRKILFFI